MTRAEASSARLLVHITVWAIAYGMCYLHARLLLLATNYYVLKTTMYTYYCSTCTCEVKGLVGMIRVTFGREHGPKVESVKADR